jgi:phosphoribosylglycinamide formyltransferase-1
MRLAMFASGSGTNLQAILDACADGTIAAKPVVVVGNNSKAFALQRARDAGISVAHLSSATHPDPDDLDNAILKTLVLHQVDLIALAGYAKHLGPKTIEAYRNRVLNIHPASLPRFGGQGMWGLHVHEAVLQSGVSESAATVHLVDEEYDRGDVLAVAQVPVLPDDTPESLQQRVHQAEYPLYVETLARIASGDLVLPD